MTVEAVKSQDTAEVVSHANMRAMEKADSSIERILKPEYQIVLLDLGSKFTEAKESPRRDIRTRSPVNRPPGNLINGDQRRASKGLTNPTESDSFFFVRLECPILRSQYCVYRVNRSNND